MGQSSLLIPICMTMPLYSPSEVVRVIRCLHLADLHLGWSPRFLGDREDERRRERDELLRRAVDFALDPRQEIGLVVIAGDLFESHRPPADLVQSVVRQLARLEQGGVRLITVPGNHDEITYHDSVYRLEAGRWPGILVTNPMPAHVATLDIRGNPCHIYSLAYTGGLTRTSPPLSSFPRLDRPGYHLAIFHGSLDWEAGDRSLPLVGNALAQAGYDYVALGHLHQHSVRNGARGPLVYAGAVEAKGFSDPGVGHLTVARIGATAGPAVERVDLPARPCRKVAFDAGRHDTPWELETALAALADPSAMIQIRLGGTANFPLEPAVLAARLRDSFYHLEIIDETGYFSDEAVARWAAEPTIRGQFISQLKRRIEAAGSARERETLYLALRKGLAAFGGDGQ